MRHLLLMIAMLTVFAGFAKAQAPPPSPCPSVSLVGPLRLFPPGETMQYTAVVSGNSGDLKYSWTVEGGKIKAGQGETRIDIERTAETLHVTVEIKGLPPTCPASVSETSTWDPAPEAVRIATVYSFETGRFEQRLGVFVDELKMNPYDQGYIILSSRRDTKSSELEARENKILRTLEDLSPPIDRSRLTLVRSDGKADLTELWRVPPGAENPSCSECHSPLCPSIKVTGPAGVTQPGEFFAFSAALEGEIPKNVIYEWTVTGGKMAEGQGTLRVSVDAEWKESGAAVTATLNVLGLPDACPKSASESAGVTCQCEPILIDEFGKLATSNIRKRLNKLFSGLSNNPKHQGYIILYGTEREMAARERILAKEVAFQTFNPPRITIVRGGTHPSGRAFTRLYRVPPGAGNPAP